MAEVVVTLEAPVYDPETVKKARELYARGFRRELLRLAAEANQENTEQRPRSQ